MSTADRQVTTGQTSSRSTLSVQPSAISRAPRPRRARRRPGRRSAAGAGPRRPTGRRPAGSASSRPARRPRRAGPRGRPGSSRSRRGTRRRRRRRSRSARPASAGRRAVAHRRVGGRVARLDLVAVHERHDRDRIRAGRRIGRHDDERLLVGVRARTRPTTRAGMPSPRTASTMALRAARASHVSRSIEPIGRALDAQRARRAPARPGVRPCPDRQAPRASRWSPRECYTEGSGLVAIATSPDRTSGSPATGPSGRDVSRGHGGRLRRHGTPLCQILAGRSLRSGRSLGRRSGCS